MSQSLPDEYDTPAEVDATFRTVRRVALWHCAVFLGFVGAVPVLTVTLSWWSDGRIIGGMSPSFVLAAFGSYVVFVVLVMAAAFLTNAVEDRMLGGVGQPDGAQRERRP